MSTSQRPLGLIGDIDRPSRMKACFSAHIATRRRGREGWLGTLGPARSPGSSVAERIVATVGLWRRRAYERRLLAKFGERERHDLGLSLADVMREAAKPFWRG